MSRSLTPSPLPLPSPAPGAPKWPKALTTSATPGTHEPRTRANRPARMIAALWTQGGGPDCFDLREFPVPRPGSGQVRVRLEGCGISPIDFAFLEQTRQTPLSPVAMGSPGAPGSEAWGRIDAVGANVTGFEPGERVAILSSHGYAQYDVADIRNVVRLPESFDGKPFLTRSLGGAANVFRRCGINKGDTIAVVGAGFLGTLITQLAALSEANVIAISRRSCALEMAKCFGATHTLPFDLQTTPRAVRELTGGMLCDMVIEAVGKLPPLDLAAELTRERGKLILAGHHHTPRAVNLPLWNARGLDIINAHEPSLRLSQEGMREAVAAVDSGLMTPGPLYTHFFPLTHLGDAMRMARERPEGCMKVIVKID